MALSASSRCERPGRLRAARNMPPVISTIVMSRFFARRQRTSMSAYFTNSLTPPTGLGLLASPFAAGTFPVGQRAARSLPERWPAVPLAGEQFDIRGSRPSTRAQEEGQPGCCPFRIESRWIGASCWRGDRKRSIHFLRALYDIPRPREPSAPGSSITYRDPAGTLPVSCCTSTA
jgi:hypothetical protein